MTHDHGFEDVIRPIISKIESGEEKFETGIKKIFTIAKEYPSTIVAPTLMKLATTSLSVKPYVMPEMFNPLVAYTSMQAMAPVFIMGALAVLAFDLPKFHEKLDEYIKCVKEGRMVEKLKEVI